MTEKIDTGEALEIINVAPTQTVRMAIPVKEFIKSLQEYKELKAAIKTKEDVQSIQGHEFLKKSYWRKVNNAFNLSVRIIKEVELTLDNGDTAWDFTCEAMATNGRIAPGTGSCSLYEKAKFVDGKFQIPIEVWKKNPTSGKSFKEFARDPEGNIKYDPAFPNTRHNARSTAETRAYNRCVSNLVGGGEVSWEEAEGNEEQYLNSEPEHPPIKPHETTKPPVAKTETKTETKPAVNQDINAKPCNDEQVEAIKMLVAVSPNPKEVGDWIERAYKVQYFGQLSYDKAKKVIAILEKQQADLKAKMTAEANTATETVSGDPVETPAEEQGHTETPKTGKPISQKQIDLVNKLLKHYKERSAGKLSVLLVGEGATKLETCTSWQATALIKKLIEQIDVDKKARAEDDVNNP
jgi:hypothetical protein